MKNYKRWFLATILLIIVLCFWREKLRDGFSLQKIQSRLPYKEKWDIAFSHTLGFSEPFHYLNKGSQCFVFISHDEKYVLKFFKHYRWRFHPWMDKIPSLFFPNHLKEKIKQRKQEALEDTFKSCIFAFSELRDITQISYLHLHKTMYLPKKLILIDRLGKKITIDPNDYEFIIQRNIQPADKQFLLHRKRGTHEEAKKDFKALLSLLIFCRNKGFNDKDPHLIKNFGFLDGKALEMDVGGFFIDPKKDLKYFYNHEMEKIQKKVLPWFHRFYPELEEFIKLEFQKKPN